MDSPFLGIAISRRPSKLSASRSIGDRDANRDRPDDDVVTSGSSGVVEGAREAMAKSTKSERVRRRGVTRLKGKGGSQRPGTDSENETLVALARRPRVRVSLVQQRAKEGEASAFSDA